MIGDESPWLGLWEDAYMSGLVSTERWDTNYLSCTSGD